MLLETDGGFDFTGADCKVRQYYFPFSQLLAALTALANQSWLEEVGFREVQVHQLVGAHSMVLGYK
jgi:hypothetical protein